MKVAILTTGRTEWLGLPTALGRLFPCHDFYGLPHEAEVRSNGNRHPCHGFTNMLLTGESVENPPDTAIELVDRAAEEALDDTVDLPCGHHGGR